MSDWSTFEKVACSLLILGGLVLGWGIVSLGQEIIDVKTQNYALMLERETHQNVTMSAYGRP